MSIFASQGFLIRTAPHERIREKWIREDRIREERCRSGTMAS